MLEEYHRIMREEMKMASFFDDGDNDIFAMAI